LPLRSENETDYLAKKVSGFLIGVTTLPKKNQTQKMIQPALSICGSNDDEVSVIEVPATCSVCDAAMWFHDTYVRQLKRKDGSEVTVTVPRIVCGAGCSKPISILPDGVLPYKRYVAEAYLEPIGRCLDGESTRHGTWNGDSEVCSSTVCRAARQEEEAAKEASVIVQQDCVELNIELPVCANLPAERRLGFLVYVRQILEKAGRLDELKRLFFWRYMSLAEKRIVLFFRLPTPQRLQQPLF